MSKHNCSHCQGPVEIPVIVEEFSKEKFCCHGCSTVYSFIQGCGLSQYYKIKEDTAGPPASLLNEKFNYLDTPEFQQKYSQITSNSRSMKFYLQGVHCAACLWIIEKIPELHPQVTDCRLDMSKSVVTITVRLDGCFAPALRSLNNFGYTPYPILDSAEESLHRQKEERSMLIKMAVAFACSGNIMLLAISDYAGAQGALLKHFHWYSLILAIPVFAYSAIPFYQSAWYALKGKNISIDVPIVLSLVLGFGMSVVSIFTGKNLVYFDTLTALIFFMLLTRYLLRICYHKSLNSSEMAELFAGKVVQRLDTATGEYKDTFARLLKTSNLVRVATQQMLPVDCELLSDHAYIDCSILNGESVPVSRTKGDLISSGSVNVGPMLQLRVVQDFEHSRLGEIMAQVEAGWRGKSPIINLADRCARYFTCIVLGLAFITLLATWATTADFQQALVRTLALIIITCPCALALTTPLVLSMALTKLARAGLIVKSEHTLEKLSRATSIFLDKTGTLTHGRFQITQLQYYGEVTELQADALALGLESHSSHPIAISLVEYMKKKYEKNLPYAPLQQLCQQSGVGVSASFNGKCVRMGGVDSEAGVKRVGLFQDQVLLASFDLSDGLRQESIQVVKQLAQMGLNISLLSGDNFQLVQSMAQKLGITNFYAQITPEQKANILSMQQNTIMVGDGANDAIALAKASVGIAVKGSMEISLRACEVFITGPGLIPIATLIAASKKVMNLIKINFTLSIGYNLIAIVLAMHGNISPLTAAIIMPLSSLTVLAVTLLFGHRLEQFINMSKHDLNHKGQSKNLIFLGQAKANTT